MPVPSALVLVRSARESAETVDLVKRARGAAAAVELPLIKAFRATRGTVAGERWHGPVQFLDPNAARDLYNLAHRWRLLVLSFARIYVRRDPSRQPVVRRAALDLGTFVLHKAEFELVRDRPALERLIPAFVQNRGSLSCTGEDDPRCLPLHVFSVSEEWSGLRNQSGRDAFADLYGPARSRVDAERKRWARADRRAYHGADELTIAGHDLSPGMHWDVTSERGRARLTTAHEVWEVPPGSAGYVNVYPDAYVRSAKRSKARRVWPKRAR